MTPRGGRWASALAVGEGEEDNVGLRAGEERTPPGAMTPQMRWVLRQEATAAESVETSPSDAPPSGGLADLSTAELAHLSGRVASFETSPRRGRNT